MFLFEDFTYNGDWAARYYDDFYDASPFIADFLNKDYKGNGEFSVKHLYDHTHENNNRYKIFYLNKADIFNGQFTNDAIDYVIDKFNNSNGVYELMWPDEKLLKDNKMPYYLIIQYNIVKDEDRWNIEHQNMNTILTNIKNYFTPTLETWLYMLGAYYHKKNPARLFGKENDIIKIGQKYVVAVKMGWVDAEDTLNTKISDILAINEDIKNKYPRLLKVLHMYANDEYEVDKDIQELIDDYKYTSKNISQDSIPTILLEVAKALDNNVDVKRYELCSRYSYAFNIECSNGNVGRMYLDSVDSDWNKRGKFFRFAVSLKDSIIKDEKMNGAYTLKNPQIFVDACVRAIYKKDPQEIHNVIIKIK